MKEIEGSRQVLSGHVLGQSRRRKGLLRTPAGWLALAAIALAVLYGLRPVTSLEAGRIYQVLHFQKNPVVRVPAGKDGAGYDVTIATRFHKPITVPVLRSSLTLSMDMDSRTLRPTSVASTEDSRIGILKAEWNPGVMLPDPVRRSPKDWGIKK